MKRKDKNDVSLIATIYTRPKSVIYYNNKKLDIDNVDQHLATYST